VDQIYTPTLSALPVAARRCAAERQPGPAGFGYAMIIGKGFKIQPFDDLAASIIDEVWQDTSANAVTMVACNY
jgi:hypothetical protein